MRNALLVALVSATLVMTGTVPAFAAVPPSQVHLRAAVTSATFDRTYLWDIAKEVDAPTKIAEADGTATFDYSVAAVPDGFVDSNWKLSGWISVTHDDENTLVTQITATVPGGTCDTDDRDVHIGAGNMLTRSYSCDFTDEPDPGVTVTSTVEWADGSKTLNPPVEFVRGDQIDLTVAVMDDKSESANPVSLGAATWNEAGTPTVFPYSLTLDGGGGGCVDFTNTAWLEVTGTDPTATQVVALCGHDMVVTSSARAQFGTTHHWHIAKSVDDVSKHADASGRATFEFTVEAIPDGATGPVWELSGQIAVKNASAGTLTAIITTSVDVGGGATCAVSGGVDAVFAAGATRSFDYACTFTSQPAQNGTRTVSVTWDGGTTLSTTAPVDFALVQTDRTVDVIDDKTDPANPVTLGTATWNAAGTPIVFPYSLTLEASAGCVDFTSAAWLGMTGPSPTAEQIVELCGNDMTVSSNAAASFDRTYHWDLDKGVDSNSKDADASGEANFDYTVEATPDGSTDSAWALSGEIEVSNASTGALTASVTSGLDVGGGAACSVDGGVNAVFTAGQTRTFDLECTFTSEPAYNGTRTVTVAWGGGTTISTTAPVTFTVDGETDRTVEVRDDKTDPANPVTLGQATWNAAGTPIVFPYSLTLHGVGGDCVDFTNTAWISVSAGVSPEAKQTVELCFQGVTMTHDVTATYDRTYFWDIDKGVDADSKVADSNGRADFDYVVTAVPDGFIDSGWEMVAQITVVNNDPLASVEVDLIHSISLGVAGVNCTVFGGTNVLIAPGATSVVDYSCTFTSAHDSGTSLVTAIWAGGSVAETIPVAFAVDEETDRTVDVRDDKTDPANPVTLGTATWNAAGTPIVFPYSLTLEGVGGDCVDFTNTAWVDVTVGSDPSATQTVELCDVSVVPDVATQVVDGTPTLESDGSWTVRYEVTVSTPAANTLPARYSLSDTLAFGPGLTVLQADVAAGAGTPAPLSTWTGAVPQSLVTNGEVVLLAGQVHTYLVTVRVDVANGLAASLAARCATGDPASAGLLNVVVLAANGVTRSDDVCAAPAAVTAPAEIPRTGADIVGPAGFAAALLALGALLLAASRRRYTAG